MLWWVNVNLVCWMFENVDCLVCCGFGVVVWWCWYYVVRWVCVVGVV